MKKKIIRKRKPKYKQMAFETAVRNPERYIGLLSAVKDFEGQILNDETLLKIVSHLYIIGEVTSPEIEVDEKTTIDDIKDKVEFVNSTRKADGGFPQGYAARFWTYMRTPSELGFVYAQYGEKFQFSDITKKLINSEIDEQEAFSIQAMKYNRKSPYRNLSNDFNFFRFILKLLLKLKAENKSLSYEQFIVASFSKDGDVDETLKTLKNNNFKDFSDAYKFVQKKYGVTTRENTVTKDYPDVVRRVFIISGFITIRYLGKKLIQINDNKLNYINDLLKIDFSLTETEKTYAEAYFKKLNTKTIEFLEIAKKYREEDIIKADEYTNKLFSIIKDYKINEKLISESIGKIGTKKHDIEEFKEIPEPLKLEFYISILIVLKYGQNFVIRPNYKADHTGKPYSHAPGNKGDIEVFSKAIYWLLEVTLIRNKTQQLNHETTAVIRHLSNNVEFKNYLNKYLSFIAPVIHSDTKEFYDYWVVKSKKKGYNVSLKPYSIKDFVDITLQKENLSDMEKYTQNVFDNF